MPKVQIPINGITTNANYTEGDCYSLVNMRIKNGATQPIPPRKVIKNLKRNYDIVFVHKTIQGTENYIGVTNNPDGTAHAYFIPEETTHFGTINSKVLQVQQTGSILTFVTEERLYYSFFDGTTYKVLGELPELPVLSFSNKEETTEDYNFKDYYPDDATYTKDTFIEKTKGMLYKGMQKYVDEHQIHLFDAYFIRYAFRLYDGTLTKQSPPILVMPEMDILDLKSVDYGVEGNMFAFDSWVNITGYRLNISYDFDLGDWKEMIKSIDIFMSPALGISSPENMKSIDDFHWAGQRNTERCIKEISSTNLQTVQETSTFYLVKSIDVLDEKDSSSPNKGNIVFPESKDDKDTLDALMYKERMTDDSFSNHSYGAGLSYTYNNRLHLSDLKTTFFNGFRPDYFKWGSAYNGKQELQYIFSKYRIEVTLDIGMETKKVWVDVLAAGQQMMLSAYFSYPDARATHFTIYGELQNGQTCLVADYNLKPHNFLNLAYFVNADLSSITPLEPLYPVNFPDYESKLVVIEKNKLKVSELSNPVNFPNANTYQVGNGNIIAMSSYMMNVSDRNFGQYPLYLFTTDGIWTLNVGGGEVVYSTLSAPTSIEVPVSPIVASTPYGVAFLTHKGLHLINGNQVTFLSEQLEYAPKELAIEIPKGVNGIYKKLYGKTAFNEFIKGVMHMYFNPYENELILANKSSHFDYVYSFQSGYYYISNEWITGIVGNTYPDLYALELGKVKDYGQTGGDSASVIYISRPLLFGTNEIKKMERVILRGILDIQPALGEDNGRSALMIHYSFDNRKYDLLRGALINPVKRKDYDLGMMLKSKYAYFMFSFIGQLHESTDFENFDVMIEKEYTNSKMR